MTIEFRIRVGTGGDRSLMRKSIDLPITPVAGMTFEDGARKLPAPKVTDVTIECMPGKTPCIAAQLENDESAPHDELRRAYQDLGWSTV